MLSSIKNENPLHRPIFKLTISRNYVIKNLYEKSCIEKSSWAMFCGSGYVTVSAQVDTRQKRCVYSVEYHRVPLITINPHHAVREAHALLRPEKKSAGE